jgi:hypothetical protein
MAQCLELIPALLLNFSTTAGPFLPNSFAYYVTNIKLQISVNDPSSVSSILQPMVLPKARTRKLPFWANFDFRDQFTYISMSFAQIEMRYS